MQPGVQRNGAFGGPLDRDGNGQGRDSAAVDPVADTRSVAPDDGGIASDSTGNGLRFQPQANGLLDHLVYEMTFWEI